MTLHPPSSQSQVTPLVTCRVNTGPLGKATPVIFEPDENGQFSPGLEIQESLPTVKGGKLSKIEIDVCNTTKHDIVLQSRTVLGRLQLVQSVLPVDVI